MSKAVQNSVLCLLQGAHKPIFHNELTLGFISKCGTGRKEGSGLRSCSWDTTDLLVMLPSWLYEIPWQDLARSLFSFAAYSLWKRRDAFSILSAALCWERSHIQWQSPCHLFCAPKPVLSTLCSWVRSKVECNESKQCMLCVWNQNMALSGSFCSWEWAKASLNFVTNQLGGGGRTTICHSL